MAKPHKTDALEASSLSKEQTEESILSPEDKFWADGKWDRPFKVSHARFHEPIFWAGKLAGSHDVKTAKCKTASKTPMTKDLIILWIPNDRLELIIGEAHLSVPLANVIDAEHE